MPTITVVYTFLVTHQALAVILVGAVASFLVPIVAPKYPNIGHVLQAVAAGPSDPLGFLRRVRRVGTDPVEVTAQSLYEAYVNERGITVPWESVKAADKFAWEAAAEVAKTAVQAVEAKIGQ